MLGEDRVYEKSLFLPKGNEIITHLYGLRKGIISAL